MNEPLQAKSLLPIHYDRVSTAVIECAICNNWQQSRDSDDGICRAITTFNGVAWICAVLEIGDEAPTLKTHKEFSCNQYVAIPRWQDEQLFEEESK